MKIAYLIVAHNQPRHLQRLIRALNTENAVFYVHIDGKSDISAFLEFDIPENVHFLEERVRVYHGGFSLTWAIALLMREAMRSEDVDYFQYLSGWDYPIKSNAYIHEFLSRSHPMNFMNFYPLLNHADWVNNINKYYFVDVLEAAPALLKLPIKAVKFLLKHLPFKRPFFENMIPYRGSTCFCLNRATIAYINDFLLTERGGRYANFFKYVSCSDEIFFQTLVLNSPFAQMCRYYERDIKSPKFTMKNENNAYLHYIDWNAKRENPALLDMTDFEALMNCDALYARKFKEDKSKQVLDAIDQCIGAPASHPIVA